MSEDFKILYSDSKESGSHHSHHHSDGEHHSSHHHSDGTHHGSHHHSSHRHSKQRKRRNRILIITLSIVACLLIAIGVGGAYGYKIAKREVADVKQQAYTLKADLKNVMAGLKAQDPVATETACDQLDVAIEDINKTFDKKIWKTAYKIPKFKGYIDSVKELLDLVQEASSDIARPTVAVLNDYPLSGLKVDDGFSITTINAYLSLLEDIEPKIDHIVTAMNQVDLPMGLNSMIADYSVQIASMTGSYDNLKEFLPLFKTFIGDGSDRTYLLAAQNSSEIRASGGFPGSIGTIRIRDGVLTIGDFSSVYKVLASYTPSAANITSEEKELFGSWMNGPRDACFDPDFERVAYIWALAYEQKNSEHVNGVVSLTPAIIQGMLEYIGNVTLSDGTELTSENATKVLQYDLYYKYLNANASATAGDYVDDLFAETAKATMSKLVSDFDVKKAGDYYKVFSDGAKNRTVMMWMEDEEEQELVKNAGCSGGLNEDPENPETGVYFSISDPCKLGWFLDIDTEIGEPVVNDDGTRTYDVTATYSNVLSNADKVNAGNYILGSYGGTITGYIHIFAPAGGTISDIKTSNGGRMYTGTYHNLDVAYMFGNSIAPGASITITYKVTTAAGVTTPLGVNSTPTLQNYR